MSSSGRAAALTAAGVLGALAAGVGIGAGVYASLAPSSTTTALESGSGRTEDASDATTGALTIDSPNNFAISDAIQTGAAINHGNSGRPLLNAAGQVIGVNSQIQSESGGNEGVDFAIPSNTARSVAAQIVAGKAPAHAYLGVEVRDLSSPLGALLAQVLPGTPAAKAGLKAGDVITALDARAVTGEADVSTIIRSTKPGEALTLTYERGSTIATLKVELTSRPS